MPNASNVLEDKVIPWIHNQFQEVPSHYHKEDEIHPYLISELQRRLSPGIADIEYRYDHLKPGGNGYPDKFKNIDPSQVRRVQSEPKFYNPGDPNDMTDVDFAVLPASGGVVQAKKGGVGKYIDAQSDVELIGEIKHSRNRGNKLYGKNQGLTDIKGLDQSPVDPNARYFILFDWWPKNNGTFPSQWRKLQNKIGSLSNEIKIIYLGRNGEYKSRLLS